MYFYFSKILAPQSYSDNSSLNKVYVYVCMYVMILRFNSNLWLLFQKKILM